MIRRRTGTPSLRWPGGDGPVLRLGLVPVLCVVIAVGFLFAGPAGADTVSVSSPPFTAESIEQSPTLQLERTVRLPIAPLQVRYLLNHLDLACGIIRGWELERFRARRLGPGQFLADDGSGMHGRINVVRSDQNRSLLVGWGRYRSSSLGFTLRGRAVARFRIKPLEGRRSEVKSTLSVKVDNLLLHAIGRLLSPLVNRIAHRKSDHLVTVARKTTRRIINRPVETGRRLRQTRPELIQAWQGFPRLSPDYLAARGPSPPHD